MGDEIDELLLLSLKQAGIVIASLQNFSADTLVNAVGTCLNSIIGNDTLPTALPEEMSGKFEVCTQLAEKMLDFNYPASSGDLGFQQFLYPDDKESRKMLSFLAQKMPKSGEDGGEMQGANVQLFSDIVKELGAWKKKPWFPPLRGSGLTTPLATTTLLSMPGEDAAPYAARFLPVITDQLRPSTSLAASLSEHNTIEIARKQLMEESATVDSIGEGDAALPGAVLTMIKSGFNKTYKAGDAETFDSLVSALAGEKEDESALGRATSFTQEEQDLSAGKDSKASSGETPAEAQARKKREAQEEMDREIAELEEKLAHLMGEQDSERREADMLAAQIRQLEENIREATAAMKVLEEEYLIKQRTLELLDDVDGNKKKLQELCDKTANNLVALATEWENHRVPLISQYRKQKDAIAKRKEDAKAKLIKVKEMREESKALVRTLRDRDELAKALADEYEKMPKDVKRSSYVNRILDIIKNVNKQKAEIDRILKDVQTARAEINAAIGKNSRSFAAVDELVFQDAKSNPHYKAVYKVLVEMHEAFQKLDSRVTEGGRMTNEIDRLQARISDMAAKNDALDMKRILKDLKAIQKENESLLQNRSLLKPKK